MKNKGIKSEGGSRRVAAHFFILRFAIESPPDFLHIH